MRILMISCTFPEAINSSVHGVFQRMGMFVDALKDLGDLEMLFYVSPDVDISAGARRRFEADLSRHFGAGIRLSLCHKYWPSENWSRLRFYSDGLFNFSKQFGYVQASMPEQVRAFEDCLGQKPDVIFAQTLKSICPIFLSRKKLPQVFFDINDIDHIVFSRNIRQPPRRNGWPLMFLRVPAIRLGERKAIRMSKFAFVCSELDRKYLRKAYHLSGVTVVPNAVTIPEEQRVCEDPTVLFLGSYGYQPNVVAAEYLVEKIWPIVMDNMPKARLIIAGKEPQNLRCYSDQVPGVEFPGFIDDLDELYSRTRIVCTPIFSGGGTRIKIIEAAAYAKPILTTSIGAEGIPMQHGQELMIHDNQRNFADACLALLKDFSLCQQLGNRARKFVIEYYDRKKNVELIKGLFRAGMGVPL
jgi:glycosyltransferase involved in cell wall biosynthesis